MLLSKIREWLDIKWAPEYDRQALVHDYLAAFSTEQGRRVLDHLVDSVYCTVYEGNDPITMAMHNARRSVVHEIMQNMDYGRNPNKYVVEIQELEMERP